MTCLCWFGIRTTARANEILLAFMSVVMVAFLARPSGTFSLTSTCKDSFHSRLSTIPRLSAFGDRRRHGPRATTYIGSMASAFSRRKLRTRGETSCWRRSWCACSLGCSLLSRFSWRSGLPGLRTLANSGDRFHDVAKWSAAITCSSRSPLCSWYQALRADSRAFGAVRLLYGMAVTSAAAEDLWTSQCAARQPDLQRRHCWCLAYIGTLTMQWERSVEILISAR